MPNLSEWSPLFAFFLLSVFLFCIACATMLAARFLDTRKRWAGLFKTLPISPAVSVALLIVSVSSLLFCTALLSMFYAPYSVVFRGLSGLKNDTDIINVLVVSSTFLGTIFAIVGVTWQTRVTIKAQNDAAREEEAKRIISCLTMLITEAQIISDRACVVVDDYETRFIRIRRYRDRKSFIRNDPGNIIAIGCHAYDAALPAIGSIYDLNLIHEVMWFYSSVQQLLRFCDGQPLPAGLRRPAGAGRWQHFFARKVLARSKNLLPRLEQARSTIQANHGLSAIWI